MDHLSQIAGSRSRVASFGTNHVKSTEVSENAQVSGVAILTLIILLMLLFLLLLLLLLMLMLLLLLLKLLLGVEG